MFLSPSKLLSRQGPKAELRTEQSEPGVSRETVEWKPALGEPMVDIVFHILKQV